MTYRKVGGLRFVRIGRFGFSWFVSKRKHRCGAAAHVTSQGTARAALLTDALEARMARAARRRVYTGRDLRTACPPVEHFGRSFNPHFEG